MMDKPPRPPETAVPPTSRPWTRTAGDRPPPPQDEAGPSGASRSEPMFNSPWPITATVALLVLIFFGQLRLGLDASIERYGMAPIALSAGRWQGLPAHLFLHGGWTHLLLNTTALLAFGAPVARLFGRGGGGALRFFAFFMACGVAGGLAFWALHPQGGTPLVGASGAVSGLIGAVARLMGGRGRLSGPFSRTALSFLAPWVVLNLLIAAAGLALGPALPIAWEAHLGGLLAGLLTVGLLAPRALIPPPD